MIDGIEADMAARGISPRRAVPPLWRVFWRWGLDIPPPLFWSFDQLVLLFGGGAGLIAVLGLLVMGAYPVLPLGFYVAFVVLSGGWHGVRVARRLRKIAHDHSLPRWSVYLQRFSGG